MLYDNSNLLDRINSAIINKWYTKGIQLGDLPDVFTQEEDQTDLINKKKFTDTKNGELIEKLQEKIMVLENQYDQLLYFINFLVDNLPNLVLNISQPGSDTKQILTDTGRTEKLTASRFNGNTLRQNDEPQPTRREKDVLDLLEKGLCAKEIACRLFISETTVVTHKKNLKEKFNAKNTAELISKVQSQISNK